MQGLCSFTLVFFNSVSCQTSGSSHMGLILPVMQSAPGIKQVAGNDNRHVAV